MQKFDFLVIESDQTRLEAVMSALHFLGYQPRHGALDTVADESKHAWRGVYVGQVEDAEEAERQLALLGGDAAHVPMLVSEDSAWLERFSSTSSSFATRMAALPYPLRYEQMAGALRNVYARLLGNQNGNGLRFVGQSVPMTKVNTLIRQVAPFDSSVLVLGDSGTGKEL
ncbi:MAG: sigma 54-interacting transcriptional regulator, partial [Rhodanobacter sp.]